MSPRHPATLSPGPSPSPLPPDLLHDLQQAEIEIRADPVTRLLYSTDASIYQIVPLGVVFPRTIDELSAAIALSARYSVPVLPRGSGSSLAGQAVGAALVLDCSRYLNHVLDLNPDTRTATVEPGVILNSLNRLAKPYGLQFGPDPASAERATLGGSLANNATGAHSIQYGMCADHIISADVVLADGSLVTFEELSLDETRRRVVVGSAVDGSPPLEASFYNAVLRIREKYADTIRSRWPHPWRRASGYNLNYLLPWTPSVPQGWNSSFNPKSIYNQSSQSEIRNPASEINLAPLLAGSEGTLAVMRRLRLGLVPLPRYTVLGVLAYDSLASACDAVPALLQQRPSAIELICQSMIRLSRSVPAYARQLSWVRGDPVAMLVVEFSGENPTYLRQQVQALRSDVVVADSAAMQNQVWAVRKVALGVMQSRPGDIQPATFIEDLAVPVENLGKFVREMDRLMADFGTTGDFYAHASAGCLHFRPLLNLKTAEGVAMMRAIAEQSVDLVLSLGGTTSGEHGDGLARSEWLERVYGKEIVSAFRELKAAADPHGLLNPGKIVDPPPMDRQLRWNATSDLAWTPIMDFTRQGGAVGAAGLLGAIEMCNGAGVCRKIEGVMCPSFQATQDELHSTRGRANLLRSMMVPDGQSRPLSVKEVGEKVVYQALDLCLACKGCKSECPSAVDMAKLKYEFLHHYYASHRRRLRDYLFGYIGTAAPLGSAFAPLVNWVMRSPHLRRWFERAFGLTCQRPFPRFASHSLASAPIPECSVSQEAVLFLPDTFNRFFYPEVETMALETLRSIGVTVTNLPVLGAGRTLISKGFLSAARKHAARVVEAVERLDPRRELPIVGLEPSEIYTLRDEFLDFFPNDERVHSLASRSFMIDEYLVRPGRNGDPRLNRVFQPKSESEFGSPNPKSEIRNSKFSVLLHGHCYQKAQPLLPDGYPTGVVATVKMLELLGYRVQVVDDGCCGMAGAFGYEAEHYDLSMQVGELVLFPAIRAAKEAQDEDILIVAAGVSCQSQITDGTRQKALHPILLVNPHVE